MEWNRKANLFFNQDDVGMFKTKGVLRWKDTIFRMARSEACVILAAIWLATGIQLLLLRGHDQLCHLVEVELLRPEVCGAEEDPSRQRAGEAGR